MRIDLRYKYLSRPRYNRYLAATGNDANLAKRLYNANIRLAQAFHPILSQFEVVLRNALSQKLTVHFGNADWIIDEKTGFMSHRSLHHSHYFLKTSVQKAEHNLVRRGIPITSGKIISDQNFGFWVAFFLAHHYGLVGGQPIYVFANKPSTEDRASIYSKLDDIRNFRNRVNHCEPICFHGHTIDCAEAIEIRTKLYNLVQWIDPSLVQFFSSIDNTQSKIDQITNLI